MIRKLLIGSGLAGALTLAVGCTDASNGGKPVPTSPDTKNMSKEMKEAYERSMAGARKAAEDAAIRTKEAKEKAMGGFAATAEAIKDGAQKAGDKAKELTKEAADKLRENVLKPVTEAMPKVEEKMKSMTGDAAKTAKEKYDALKKLVEEFKAVPGEKLEEMGKTITDALAELKKSVGL